jgi:hypothetical protein
MKLELISLALYAAICEVSSDAQRKSKGLSKDTIFINHIYIDLLPRYRVCMFLVYIHMIPSYSPIYSFTLVFARILAP